MSKIAKPPSSPDARAASASASPPLSQQDAIERMMGKAIEQFGAVDILFNNAGIQFVAPIDEFPVAKWNAILALNLTASFHTIRLALPAMKAKKWGRIVNIASAHALVASPYKSAYGAAKHGIAGLTKTVALEVAAFTAFLASNAAASFTGAVIPIDGGWTAQ